MKEVGKFGGVRRSLACGARLSNTLTKVYIIIVLLKYAEPGLLLRFCAEHKGMENVLKQPQRPGSDGLAGTRPNIESGAFGLISRS
jgi:hypothetical protein